MFATASQNLPEPDVGQNVSSAPGRCSGSAEAGGIGNKRKVTNKLSEDSGGLANALAATLAMPVSAAIPCADTVLGDGDMGEVAPLGTGTSSQAAGSAPGTNIEANAQSFSPVTATVGGGTGSLANSQVLPPITDIVGSAAPASNNADVTEDPVADKLAKQAVPATKTGDSLAPPVVQISAHPESHAASAISPVHRQNSPDSVNRGRQKEAPVTTDSSGPITSAASSLPPANQDSGASIAAGTAVVDPAAQQSSVASTAAAPKADPNKTAKPGADTSLPSADAATAAPPSHSAFVVDATAATQSARDRRGNSLANPEDGVSAGDSFPGAAQSTPSPQAAVPVASQAIGGPPHSTFPSPPLSEQAAAASPSRPDATPAPAPPALQTVQVLQRMDKAEIRIGLQSTDFGAIRLHTTVANDQVGAAVSTSHPALRDALLFEAPALEKAMARHSLRLDSVSVDCGSANSNFNSFGNSERQQPRAGPSGPAPWPAARPRQSQSAATATPGTLEGNYRLDVRA